MPIPIQEGTPVEKQAARAAAAAATAAARAAAAAGTASVNRGPWASNGSGRGVIGGGNGGGAHACEDDLQTEKARRQVGRWIGEEVAALIEGVLLHGTSWAAIYDSCRATGRINPERRKVGQWARR